MKDKIIDETIKSLRTEGLRFSVDSLAERLKISKKTVYKYFPDKEALALAMYEKYYKTVNEKISELTERNDGAVTAELLYLYFDAKKMIRRDIFNKYKLNDVIRAYTSEQNDFLWERIAAAVSGRCLIEETAPLRIIVDGAFEKLCEEQCSPDGVIERLVRLI
ncbi:MAG: TetR/AcrR family transcriptional regulator [Huintestinicola sp.]